MYYPFIISSVHYVLEINAELVVSVRPSVLNTTPGIDLVKSCRWGLPQIHDLLIYFKS
jgi:hypothetical protein